MSLEKVIFHIDVNSAFLSWEAVYRLHHRAWAGNPHCICLAATSLHSFVSTIADSVGISEVPGKGIAYQCKGRGYTGQEDLSGQCAASKMCDSRPSLLRME